MTPRPNIVAIQADETLEALHELVVNEQYSRIPVFQASIDDVVGFVHVRDMFEVPESAAPRRKVRELMRPIRFVPETKPVNDLMREMQQEGAHMVIVVDEYGNTAGLATMEDLVEVILGEIRDEHEPDSDVTEDGHGGYIVSGNFDLARVADVSNFVRTTTSNRPRSAGSCRMAGPCAQARRSHRARRHSESKCWPATRCASSRCV